LLHLAGENKGDKVAVGSPEPVDTRKSKKG